MGYINYNEYKDSKIDIVGLIPKYYEITKLKFLCNIKTGNKDTVDNNPNGKYPFYVRSPIIEKIDSYSYDGEAILMAGDGVGAGKVFHYINGKFDYHQRVYNFHKFKNINPKFLYYYMSSLFSIEIEKGSAKSTVDSIRLPMVENFLICYPPLDEQQQIANYLDKKTAKIDATIAKNEELIQLLEEKRVALINQVVTKGLNPDVPMKDSGIEWMGKIPEYWRVSFLKRFVYSISSGKTKNCDENGKYPLYGSTGIIGYTNDMDYNGTFVLIARVGANAGKTHIAEGKMGITDNTLIVKYTPEINYKFLFYILTIYDFKTLTIGSGQPLITGNNVKDIKICVPPLNEQEQFVEYLDNKMTGIKSIISKIKKNIVLLKEYKTSLIHHVVTGKVDVRGEEL